MQANGVDKWNEENKEILKQNTWLLRRNSIQDLFNGYYYDDEKMAEKEQAKRSTTAIPEKVIRHRKAFSLKW